MVQHEFTRFVECLRQNHTLMVFMTCQNLFLTDIELSEHHARQCLLVAFFSL